MRKITNADRLAEVAVEPVEQGAVAILRHREGSQGDDRHVGSARVAQSARPDRESAREPLRIRGRAVRKPGVRYESESSAGLRSGHDQPVEPERGSRRYSGDCVHRGGRTASPWSMGGPWSVWTRSDRTRDQRGGPRRRSEVNQRHDLNGDPQISKACKGQPQWIQVPQLPPLASTNAVARCGCAWRWWSGMHCG